MRAEDIGYMLFGAGLVLLFRMILDWDEARTAAREAQERLDEVILQPNPEEGYDYMTREAKRVELPLEERSVPGVVVLQPGQKITFEMTEEQLLGARAK